MDRVEVVSTDDTVKTLAGTFEHCVHLRETTPLERDVSHKYYAPGIGIIKDDEFELAERPGTPLKRNVSLAAKGRTCCAWEYWMGTSAPAHGFREHAHVLTKPLE